VENNSYFNYFTEIEEHFCRRRGTVLILSTLDWMLMETWKEAGIPLEAVLRGIDAAFDKYDARPRKTQKINGLAYCSQAVLTAVEDMKAAAEGSTRAAPGETETGFEAPSVAEYLRRNADTLDSLLTANPARPTLPDAVRALVEQSAQTLRDVAPGCSQAGSQSLEDLERRLTVMEEKLFAALLASTADEDLVQVRAEADRELAPYRRKMSGAQIEQLHKQYVRKRLLERYGIPRLSLFYMM